MLPKRVFLRRSLLLLLLQIKLFPLCFVRFSTKKKKNPENFNLNHELFFEKMLDLLCMIY